MLARRAGDGEHVVERHRYVGERDLPDRLTERLLRGPLSLALRLALADDRLWAVG